MKFDKKSFNPQAFGKYVEMVPDLKKNEILNSGALKGNEEIANVFSSQTTTSYARIPMFGLIKGEPDNYDGQTDATSESTTTFERGVVVIGRMKGFTEKDFSKDITAGTDFMDNVAKQLAKYWANIDQDTILNILKGIFSMTGTENKVFVDNHTYDVTPNENGNVGETTLNTAIQRAAGDNKQAFTLALMHSNVATNLENLKLLAYLKYTDAQGIERPLTLATWNGRAVLIDDSMPTKSIAKVPAKGTEGTDGYVAEIPAYTEYTTYVLGQGAFDYEDIGAEVPYEMDRNASKNGGQTTLYTRQRKCFAPYGISYEKKYQASLSPTNAELANGANWALVNDENGEVIDHKSIPIARIVSKG